MRRQLLAALCLFLAVCMLGCSGQDPTGQLSPLPLTPDVGDTAVLPAATPLTARYMPLQAGNWWRYRTTTWDSSGDSVVSTYTLRIKGVEMVESKKWYRSRYVYPDGHAVDHNLYRHLAAGLWVRDTFYFKDWLHLKAPIENGARWDRAPGNLSVIKSTSSQVTVPAGTFTNCVLVETTWYWETYKYEYKIREWYAPDLGVVKLIYTRRCNSELMYSNTEVLTKTNVGP